MKNTEQISGSPFDNFALYFESFIELDRAINLDFKISKNSKGELGFEPSIKPDQAFVAKAKSLGFDMIEMNKTILETMANENRAAYVFTSVIYMMAKAQLRDKLPKVTAIAVKPVTQTETKVIFEIKGSKALELAINEGTVEKYIRSRF